MLFWLCVAFPFLFGVVWCASALLGGVAVSSFFLGGVPLTIFFLDVACFVIIFFGGWCCFLLQLFCGVAFLHFLAVVLPFPVFPFRIELNSIPSSSSLVGGVVFSSSCSCCVRCPSLRLLAMVIPFSPPRLNLTVNKIKLSQIRRGESFGRSKEGIEI